MNRRKIAANIFSNWTNVAVTMVLAFFVTPIIVRGLGDEAYGIWTLVVQATSWFTVLDLGVNTAIIRYISRAEARGDVRGARAVFSASLALFCGMALVALVGTLVIAPWLTDSVKLDTTPRTVVFAVLMIVGCEVAIGLVLSVFQASLKARQAFVRVNAIGIFGRLVKNAAIVALLLSGHGLVPMALAAIGSTVLRLLLLWGSVRPHYRFVREDCTRPLFGELMNYSFFSFLISVVTKMTFSTYSLVISILLHADQVIYFAMPITLLQYAQQVVYSLMSVLTPVISGNEARDDVQANRDIFVYGTRYTLLLILPMMIALWAEGHTFLSLWQTPVIGERSQPVLRVLAIGFGFFLAQLISNSVLKGVSRHKVYSWILTGVALATFVGGLATVRSHGLVGMAWATTIPLVLAGAVAIPWYTCRVLEMSYLDYLRRCWLAPALVAIVPVAIGYHWRPPIDSYLDFLLFCGAVQTYFGLAGAAFVLEPHHRARLLAKLRRRGG